MTNLKKALTITFVAGLIAAGLSAPANAQITRIAGGELSGSVAFTTEYVFRGVTQTNEDPTIQGSIDWAHDSGVYFGVWGSGLDFGGDESVEIDYYGGYAFTAASVDVDVGFIYYHYPGTAADLDFVEVAASVSKTINRLSVSGGVNYSPDNFGESGDAFYLHGGADYEVPIDGKLGLVIGGTLAYQDIDKEDVFGLPDYVEWSLGATLSYQGLGIDLRYHDTDLNEICGDACDSRFVVSASYSF